MEQQKLLLVFSGSFSPVHKNHVLLLRTAFSHCSREGADVLALVCPNSNRYVARKLKKGNYLPITHRVACLKHALSDLSWATVNDCGLVGEKLLLFAEKLHPTRKIIYVCGSDSLQAVNDKFLPLHRQILTVVRETAPDLTQYLQNCEGKDRVTLVHHEEDVMSSSAVRAGMHEHLHPEVLRYLQENNLLPTGSKKKVTSDSDDTAASQPTTEDEEVTPGSVETVFGPLVQCASPCRMNPPCYFGHDPTTGERVVLKQVKQCKKYPHCDFGRGQLLVDKLRPLFSGNACSHMNAKVSTFRGESGKTESYLVMKVHQSGQQGNEPFPLAVKVHQAGKLNNEQKSSALIQMLFRSAVLEESDSNLRNFLVAPDGTMLSVDEMYPLCRPFPPAHVGQQTWADLCTDGDWEGTVKPQVLRWVDEFASQREEIERILVSCGMAADIIHQLEKNVGSVVTRMDKYLQKATPKKKRASGTSDHTAKRVKWKK